MARLLSEKAGNSKINEGMIVVWKRHNYSVIAFYNDSPCTSEEVEGYVTS